MRSPSLFGGTRLHAEAADSSTSFFFTNINGASVELAGVSQIWNLSGSSPNFRYIAFVGQTLCFSNCNTTNVWTLSGTGDGYFGSQLKVEFNYTALPPAANGRDSVIAVGAQTEKVINKHDVQPFSGPLVFLGQTQTTGSL